LQVRFCEGCDACELQNTSDIPHNLSLLVRYILRCRPIRSTLPRLVHYNSGPKLGYTVEVSSTDEGKICYQSYCGRARYRKLLFLCLKTLYPTFVSDIFHGVALAAIEKLP